MLFLIEHLLILSGLLLVSLAAGLPFACKLGCGGLLERLTWGVTLGLLALAQALLLMGLLGVLRAAWLAGLILIALILGWRDLIAWMRDAWAGIAASAADGKRGWLVGGAAFVLLTPFTLAALYPPHAWDETIYHLVFARAFAESGAMPFVDQLRVPVFPPLGELLDAAMLVLADDVSTHWISWIATLCTAALLVVWSTRSRRQVARGAGAVAAALHLGTPLVIYLSGLAYVDALLALWVTAALLAWQRAAEEDSRNWRYVAGLCVGSAASVKYLALFFVAWLIGEALLLGPGGARRRLGRALELGGAAAFASLPAYVRVMSWTGNPLFPFTPACFAPRSGRTPGAAARRLEPVLTALALPWQSVFDRVRVGQMPPLSTGWLLALAALLLGAWRQREWRRALAMAAAYLLLVPPNSRYLMPILPVTALAGVASLLELSAPRALSRRGLVAVCLVLLVPGALYAGWLCARLGPLPLEARARDTFLERNVAGYRAVEFLNRSRGASYVAYGLNFEQLAYHARGLWLGDWSGPARYDGFLRAFGETATLLPYLHGLGADHLVLRRDARPLPPQAVDGGSCASRTHDGDSRVYSVVPER